MTRRRTVVILVPSLAVGGAERDIVRIAPLLKCDRFDVVVGTFSEPGSLADILRSDGVRVESRCEADERSPADRGGSRRGVRGAVALAKRALGVVSWTGRLLRSENAAIAHFILPHSYAYGMLACLLYSRSTRTVMSRLSLNYYARQARAFSWFERTFLHPRLGMAIANSALIVDELVSEGVSPRRIRLIHNGLDASEFTHSDSARHEWRDQLGIAGSAYVMLAVGNLHPHKGHLDLIEACSAANDGLPAGWVLLVAGDDVDSHRAKCIESITRHGLQDSIRFLGSVDDVPGLMSAADLFVHPSHHEGMPNAILEAMAASLPVVATAVGGVPEAVCVQPGQATGWLVEPRNPGLLAHVLIESAEDETGRVERGGAGRRRVEAEFSLEACVAAYRAVYDEIAAG